MHTYNHVSNNEHTFIYLFIYQQGCIYGYYVLVDLQEKMCSRMEIIVYLDVYLVYYILSHLGTLG